MNEVPKIKSQYMESFDLLMFIFCFLTNAWLQCLKFSAFQREKIRDVSTDEIENRTPAVIKKIPDISKLLTVRNHFEKYNISFYTNFV